MREKVFSPIMNRSVFCRPWRNNRLPLIVQKVKPTDSILWEIIIHGQGTNPRGKLSNISPQILPRPRDVHHIFRKQVGDSKENDDNTAHELQLPKALFKC